MHFGTESAHGMHIYAFWYRILSILNSILGHYMYAEGSSTRLGDKAQLASIPLRTQSNTVCLSFMYHMYGEHMGELYLYYLEENRPPGQILWGAEGIKLKYICINVIFY